MGIRGQSGSEASVALLLKHGVLLNSGESGVGSGEEGKCGKLLNVTANERPRRCQYVYGYIHVRFMYT